MSRWKKEENGETTSARHGGHERPDRVHTNNIVTEN